MMKASSLRLNLAFDQVFPLMTPKIQTLPIQLNQANRRTKDELVFTETLAYVSIGKTWSNAKRHGMFIYSNQLWGLVSQVDGGHANK